MQQNNSYFLISENQFNVIKTFILNLEGVKVGEALPATDALRAVHSNRFDLDAHNRIKAELETLKKIQDDKK